MSEKCDRCDEDFVVLIRNGNDDIPDRNLPCRWACPECGHEHFVTWQRPPEAMMDQADLRIVPDDFQELGVVIAELCTCEDMPSASVVQPGGCGPPRATSGHDTAGLLTTGPASDIRHALLPHAWRHRAISVLDRAGIRGYNAPVRLGGGPQGALEALTADERDLPSRRKRDSGA